MQVREFVVTEYRPAGQAEQFRSLEDVKFAITYSPGWQSRGREHELVPVVPLAQGPQTRSDVEVSATCSTCQIFLNGLNNLRLSLVFVYKEDNFF